VAAFRPAMRGTGAQPKAGRYEKGAYAAHAVAAAVYEAVAGGAPPSRIQERMVGMLDAMHLRNPAWAGHPTASPTGPPGPRAA